MPCFKGERVRKIPPLSLSPLPSPPPSLTFWLDGNDGSRCLHRELRLTDLHKQNEKGTPTLGGLWRVVYQTPAGWEVDNILPVTYSVSVLTSVPWRTL